MMSSALNRFIFNAEQCPGHFFFYPAFQIFNSLAFCRSAPMNINFLFFAVGSEFKDPVEIVDLCFNFI